jgi:hypothetical protein
VGLRVWAAGLCEIEVALRLFQVAERISEPRRDRATDLLHCFSSPWSAAHPVGPMAHGRPGGRGRPGHAGRAGFLDAASLRPAGGQPPPVILDDGDVVRAADASVKQSLGVQQAPQRPSRPAATAGSPGRHRRLAASTTNPGISPRLRLSHRPCLPASSGCSPALLARLFGNGTNPGRRGASPEGACRVECCCAAIRHPKVLPGRLGCSVEVRTSQAVLNAAQGLPVWFVEAHHHHVRGWA